MRFSVINFGCKVNQYQGELLRETLIQMGFEETEPNQAQTIFVNGCLVTEAAKSEATRAARKHSKTARVILTGCAGSEEKGFFEAVAPDELHKLCELLGIKADIPKTIGHFKGHTRPMVLAQLGCDNFCSYCIVPFLRGKPTDRPQGDITQEAGALAKQGHKEVVLCGTELGHRKDLVSLLYGLSNVEGIERIRLSSINPRHLTAQAVKEILGVPKVAPHLHLPLQSGSDRVLADMRRGYKRGHYLGLCEAAREVHPLIGITTDILVGFPTETDDDFKETLETMRLAKFSKCHVFPFSPRPGTVASKLEPLPKGAVALRARSARGLALHLANATNHAMIGSLQDVLVEEENEGFCGPYLRVKVLGGAPCGAMVRCQIIGFDGATLIGEKR